MTLNDIYIEVLEEYRNFILINLQKRLKDFTDLQIFDIMKIKIIPFLPQTELSNFGNEEILRAFDYVNKRTFKLEKDYNDIMNCWKNININIFVNYGFAESNSLIIKSLLNKGILGILTLFIRILFNFSN